MEEFSYAEIAAMLEIPIGTVMSRISRGRRLLYDRLATATPTASPSAVISRQSPVAVLTTETED